MQACSGATVRGSVQQPIWTKGSNFPPKGASVRFLHHVKVNLVKPCRSSRIEGSLVTGRPPSSVSVPEIGGSTLYNELVLPPAPPSPLECTETVLKKCTLFFFCIMCVSMMVSKQEVVTVSGSY